MKNKLNTFFQRMSLLKSKNTKVFYLNYSKNLQQMLDCCVQEGFIQRYSVSSDRRRALITSNRYSFFNYTLLYKPTRKFNVDYKSLVALSYKNPLTLFFVHTKLGLLSHTQAIKLKLGGFLFCKVKLLKW